MSNERYPAGTLIRIELELRVPKVATPRQIEEWLQHTILQRGGIALDHPLLDAHPEGFGAKPLEWEPTGFIGRIERFDLQTTPRGETYRIRYVREPFGTPAPDGETINALSTSGRVETGAPDTHAYLGGGETP